MSYDFPGLKPRQRKNRVALYWVARADLVKAGYRPKTVPLHYNWEDATTHPLISAACMKFQAEMLQWSATRGDDQKRFDGTVAGLVLRYQRDPASPYNKRVKWNVRESYDWYLGVIEKAFGARSLACIGLSDFQRWYDAARKPKVPGGRERINKAHKIIGMFRRMVKFGIAAGLPECKRLAEILANTEFEQPAKRQMKLTAAHVEAFIPVALEHGRLSLALGTALQFETTLRQRDVIGEWEPVVEGEAVAGIMLKGRRGKQQRRWCNGLTWADIGGDFTFRKDTTKTGQTVAHDLKLCPLVMKVLALVPAERRVGPLIIDENAGRPYATSAYQREWRVIANAAGIPREVWNMDARAGGISEGDDAGADLDALRSQAGHSQLSTTTRYVRGTIEKSRKVARLRAAHRAEQASNDQ